MAVNPLSIASGITRYSEKYLIKNLGQTGTEPNYSIVGKRNVHDVHYHFLTNA